MHENPKFHRHSVQINAPAHFVHHKNTFKSRELSSETFWCQWNAFVKQLMMNTLSTKPSLLHFLCWSLYSLRAGFTNQGSPFKLPPILAVHCETELFFALPTRLGCVYVSIKFSSVLATDSYPCTDSNSLDHGELSLLAAVCNHTL